MNDPNKLVEEFKKSGEFDRIRRELFAEFQGNKDLPSFISRIEDVARRRLTNDHNLLYMPQEFVHRELMQELERFSIVECATSEFLNDPKLSVRITSSLEKLLEDRGLLVKKKLHDVSPSGERDEESRFTPLGEGTQQSQTCRNNPDSVSAISGGTILSASKQQPEKDKDPDSMDVDED